MVRQVADLVEKERPARGHFEFAGPVAAGIRKSPLTWPNNSLSKSVSVRAPISTLTSDSSRRAESAWISRASISLPVPFSPAIRIVASVGATFSIICLRVRIASESPPEHRRLAAEFTLNLAQLLNFLLRNAQVIGRLQRGDQFRIIPGLHNEIDRPFLIALTARSMSA